VELLFVAQIKGPNTQINSSSTALHTVKLVLLPAPIHPTAVTAAPAVACRRHCCCRKCRRRLFRRRFRRLRHVVDCCLLPLLPPAAAIATVTVAAAAAPFVPVAVIRHLCLCSASRLPLVCTSLVAHDSRSRRSILDH
jgi:hypothetical protein